MAFVISFLEMMEKKQISQSLLRNNSLPKFSKLYNLINILIFMTQIITVPDIGDFESVE